MNQFDLTIFKDGNDECDATNYRKCIAINRLFHGFKYYSLLDVVHNENNREIFRHFVMEIYSTLNDDYIHFQEYHSDELEQIYKDTMNNKQFNKCDINSCSYTARHHRITGNQMNIHKTIEPQIRCYVDIMDSFHFYIFHCFEVGLRTLNANDNDDENEEETKDDIEYFDAAFARVQTQITKSDSNTNALERFSTKNSKFILTQNEDNDNDNNDNNNTTASPQTFAIGLRYYYWIYYKHRSEDDYYGVEWNINDHSGFQIKDLFIEAKYLCIKEEIRNNRYITLKQYQEETVTKVNLYIQSERFLKMTATGYATDYLHYGIKKGDSMRFEHLLSLVLYTDYTNLCTDFSATFRKKNISEPIKSVIKRNMEYFWMSKCLRECVEVFGQCYFDTKRWQKDYLRGPFYTGMSTAMSLYSFNMRLCAPTSTTKQISIALKFSGSQGMVLQLNNPYLYQYYYLHGFNASWISKYKEEDERLFFGGFWFIKIESVRIVSTKQNFERFMFSLFYLDLMLTGGTLKDWKITTGDVFIVCNLMNWALHKNKQKTKRFDAYLYETFAAFTSNKTQIVLDLFKLKFTNNTGIRELLMNNLEEGNTQREDQDMTNLFRAEIFDVFKHLQNIIINTTAHDYSFSLSMIALLNVIESSSVQQIIIKAKNENDNNNWINMLWKSSSEYLTKSYENRNFLISIKEKEDEYVELEYWFMINKKMIEHFIV